MSTSQTATDSTITELESLKADIDRLISAIKPGGYETMDLDAIIGDVHRAQATFGGWSEI